MAAVTPVPAITERVNRIRYPDLSDIMSTRGEIVEEPIARVVEDIVYVAVGKDVKESKSTLVWALQNSGGKKICIVHVHVPAQMIPLCKSATYIGRQPHKNIYLCMSWLFFTCNVCI